MLSKCCNAEIHNTGSRYSVKWCSKCYGSVWTEPTPKTSGESSEIPNKCTTPKSIDEIFKILYLQKGKNGTWFSDDWEYEATEQVDQAKQCLADWIRSKKPVYEYEICKCHPGTKRNDAIDEYEQALLAELEDTK